MACFQRLWYHVSGNNLGLTSICQNGIGVVFVASPLNTSSHEKLNLLHVVSHLNPNGIWDHGLHPGRLVAPRSVRSYSQQVSTTGGNTDRQQRTIQSERFEAKDPKRESPSESFQAKVSNGSLQKQATKLKCSS